MFKKRIKIVSLALVTASVMFYITNIVAWSNKPISDLAVDCGPTSFCVPPSPDQKSHGFPLRLDYYQAVVFGQSGYVMQQSSNQRTYVLAATNWLIYFGLSFGVLYFIFTRRSSKSRVK